MILHFIFIISIVIGLMSITSSAFGGSLANPGAMYQQDRRKIMSNMLDKKVSQLYEIRSQGKELKDKSAQSIFEYNNNSCIDWNDLNSAEKSQYEFLSQHIQSDRFKKGEE